MDENSGVPEPKHTGTTGETSTAFRQVDQDPQGSPDGQGGRMPQQLVVLRCPSRPWPASC